MGFDSSPEPEPEFNEIWSDKYLLRLWQAHIYIFPTLFLFNGLYSINSIVGLVVDKQRMQKRTIFLFTNIMLLCFTLITALMTFIDPYGSNYYHEYYESRTNFKLKGLEFLVYGMKLPCLTAAFSFIYIALMETTKFKPYSRKLHNVKYFTIIVLLHFSASLAVHLSLVLLHDKESRKYFELVFICLGIFMLFSFAISFLFIFNYCKMKHLIGGNSAHVQSVHFNNKPRDNNNRNTLSTELLDSHAAGYNTPRIPGTPVLTCNSNRVSVDIGSSNEGCDIDEEGKAVALIENDEEELEFKTHVVDGVDGVDTGIVNTGLEEEEKESKLKTFEIDGDSSITTSGPIEDTYDFMLEANDILDRDDEAGSHDTIAEDQVKTGESLEGNDCNSSNQVCLLQHETKDDNGAKGEDEDEKVVDVTYDYDDDADDDDSYGEDNSNNEGATDKVFVPDHSLAFTESTITSERNETKTHETDFDSFAPLARAETESIASVVDFQNEDPVNDINEAKLDNKEDEEADVSPSDYLQSNDIAVDINVDTPQNDSIFIEVTKPDTTETNDGISCKGYIQEVYNVNSSLNKRPPGNTIETPVTLCKNVTPLHTPETQHRLTHETTLNRSVPEFVDKSLKKLLKLTTAVTVSSLLYCAGMIYYILDVVVGIGHPGWHYCTKDKIYMMEVEPTPWLIYNTFSRLAELGMTATMSYLVRRSGFTLCREKHDKKKY